MKYIIPIITFIFLICGTVIDLLPNTMLSGTGKIIIYGLPMVMLFIDMIVKIKMAKTIEEKDKIRKFGLTGIFIIYVFELSTLLFLGSVFRAGAYYEKDTTEIFSAEHFEYYSNLVPFRTIGTYIVRLVEHTINTDIVLVNIFGNLIAFAPFGFFVPLLFDKKINSWWRFTVLMIVVVVLVEFIQFVTFVGQADVDDVILNVVGAVIVYGLMKLKFVKGIVNKMLN